MDNETFRKNVIEWAEARNLIEGSDPSAQFGKLLEEMTELYNALRTNNEAEIIDAIGDCAVVATIMQEQLDRGAAWQYKSFSFAALLVRMQMMMENSNRLVVGPIEKVLADFCYVKEVPMETCRAAAWNAIKDRKGRMVDGVFVKEA